MSKKKENAEKAEYTEYYGRHEGTELKGRSPREKTPLPKHEECGQGYHYIEGYTKSSGTEVRGYCKRGSASPSKVRLEATPGELSGYGYHVNISPSQRYQALNAASNDLGTLRVLRHLNVRAIQHKRHANIHAVMESDIGYLSLRLRLKDQYGFWIDLSDAEGKEKMADMVGLMGKDKTVELVERLQSYYLPEEKEYKFLQRMINSV